MEKVTTKNYMKEKWYPRVVRVVAEILAEKDVVTPIEVFVRLDLLKPAMVEDWRFNKIPSLEQVIQCNLSNACKILRVLHLHALARGLKPSLTVYRKWGKGRKFPLRFSKFGDPNLEAAYSTHYLSSYPSNAEARPDGSAERTKVEELIGEQEDGQVLISGKLKAASCRRTPKPCGAGSRHGTK
jgi:hypothetical protein